MEEPEWNEHILIATVLLDPVAEFTFAVFLSFFKGNAANCHVVKNTEKI